MKKNFYFLLMAVLVCGLSLSFTSCKDDDKDNNGGQSEEQQEQQAMEEQDLANARFAVLDQLAETSEAGDDFLSKTFEPGIGMPDGDDTSTRIVNTNDAETAAERFANIVGATGIDENTTSFPWKDDKLGTMTYTKVTDGTAWATVDVNIKQVPKLQKIIFRAPEQGDNNAAFKGRAYYRFGDVVAIPRKGYDNNKFWQYWVCVRPAFGPEKKEDSHWISVQINQQTNLYTKTNNNKTWFMPTKLGENKEHMQNLAEMLYAMLYPEQWEQNVLNNLKNKKMKMFGDFNKNNEPYHNKYFWQNVSKGWDVTINDGNNTQDLWHHVFNTSKSNLKKIINDPNIGLNLLYKGYSWNSEKKLDIHFWQASYTNGSGVNSNMHTAKYTEPKGNLKDVVFDCRLMGNKIENYLRFFKNDGKQRWCIIHATGSDLSLMAGSYNYDGVKEPIRKVTEFYRYWKDIDPEGGKDLNKDPEPDMPL